MPTSINSIALSKQTTQRYCWAFLTGMDRMLSIKSGDFSSSVLGLLQFGLAHSFTFGGGLGFLGLTKVVELHGAPLTTVESGRDFFGGCGTSSSESDKTMQSSASTGVDCASLKVRFAANFSAVLSSVDVVSSSSTFGGWTIVSCSVWERSAHGIAGSSACASLDVSFLSTYLLISRWISFNFSGV